MAKLSSQKAQDCGYLRAEKNKSKKGKSLASILEERDYISSGKQGQVSADKIEERKREKKKKYAYVRSN